MQPKMGTQPIFQNQFVCGHSILKGRYQWLYQFYTELSRYVAGKLSSSVSELTSARSLILLVEEYLVRVLVGLMVKRRTNTNLDVLEWVIRVDRLSKYFE